MLGNIYHVSGGAADSVVACRALAPGSNPRAAWICLRTRLIPFGLGGMIHKLVISVIDF